jgi:hypothetical protein
MQASMSSDVLAQIESRFSPKLFETGFRDPGARITAISTLDKGIDAARQFVCSLLTRRNALVPISLLPPKIIARVFHLLVPEEPPLSESYNLSWIRVMHVCRHWRQVALDDSSLWAKIWSNHWPMNTRCISDMLGRAKNSPLDIEFDSGTELSTEALLMILSHLPRTRQLRLRCLSMSHSHSVREIYNWEAPALEHFELEAPNVATLQVFGENMLFKGHAPRLRAFTLIRVVIPWSLIPRGQLTQLKITSRKEDLHSSGDLNQLIDLLVNCPLLEILALELCLPSQLDGFPHGRTIHLPHLSRLRLRSSTSRVMNMLEMFKLSSLTTLHLNCINRIPHSDSEGLFLRNSVILAQFQSSAPVDFKSLIVDIWRPMSLISLHITASTFPFTLRNHQTRNFEDDIVGNAELVLSFEQLAELRTDHVISMSAPSTKRGINWVELFSCCTNVTTMQASGQGMKSLVRALTTPTVTNAGPSKRGRKQIHDNRESAVVQPAYPAIFPNLNSLGLTALNFSEGKHDPLPLGIPFDVFKRGLQQRMEASGVPLKLLCFDGCNMSRESASDLHELVQDVYWNGNECSTDSLS